MKKICIALGITILVSYTYTVLLAQPDDIKLDNKQAFGVKQRPSVDFPHSQHMDSLECTDCHHRYVNGKNILDEDTLEDGKQGIKCADCHTGNNKYNLRQAFHSQCMGCHGKLKKEGKKTGPRLCGECHPWK